MRKYYVFITIAIISLISSMFTGAWAWFQASENVFFATIACLIIALAFGMLAEKEYKSELYYAKRI